MAKSLLGYGDIILVNTPSIDKVSQQLYAEQKQRELLQQKENQELDEIFRKEFSKVRSADAPEIINAYNQYKQIKKQSYYNDKLKRDPIAYNQMQQAANSALQDVYSKIKKSSELADMGKTLTTERMKNPNQFDDKFGSMMATFMNTPMNKLNGAFIEDKPVDLTNPDTYRYKGSNTDFSKLYEKASGEQRTILGKEIPMDKMGLQYQTPTYKFGNTPSKFKEHLISSAGLYQTKRDAEAIWDSIPQSEKEAVIKEFNNIPLQKWQKMGLEGPQDLLPKNPDNKIDAWSSFEAMRYAISQQPEDDKPITRVSEARKMQLQEEKEKRMAAMRKANSKELMQFKKDIDPNDTKMNNMWVENYLGQSIKEALAKKPVEYKYQGGGKVEEYDIPVDPVLGKALAESNVPPDAIRVDKDGNFRRIFYKRYSKDEKKGFAEGEIKKMANGDILVDETIGRQKLTANQVALALGYKAQTKNQLGKTMGSVLGNKHKTKTSFVIDGKSYTRKQLNDLGYDDNEIEDFIKQGIIK